MTKQRTPPQLSCRCQLYSTASHRMAKTDAMAAGALRSPTATGAGRGAVSAAQRSTGQHSPRPLPSLDAVDRSRQVQCTRPPSSRRPNPTMMPNPAIHPSRRDVSVDLDSQQRALCLGRRRRLANFNCWRLAPARPLFSRPDDGDSTAVPVDDEQLQSD
jgi:hypothetical protein